MKASECGLQFNLQEMVKHLMLLSKKVSPRVYISDGFSSFVCVNPVFRDYLPCDVAC